MLAPAPSNILQMHSQPRNRMHTPSCQDGIRAAVAECKAGRAQGKVVITMAKGQGAEEGKDAAAGVGEEAKVEMPAGIAVQEEVEAVHTESDADAVKDTSAKLVDL